MTISSRLKLDSVGFVFNKWKQYVLGENPLAIISIWTREHTINWKIAGEYVCY